jgi:L-gulonolactone oxidase
LPFTSDYLISLTHFDRIISVDDVNCRVKVETGITIAKLNDELHHRQMALSVLGSVSDLTLGGVINTATHGSGIRFKVISGYVREVELITSSGDLLTCSAEDKPDVFYSCLCGLGSVGVLINVTMQCEPAFCLHEHQFPATLDQVLDDLDDHLQQSDHFRFLWFPHTDHVSLSHISRVQGLVPRKPFSLTRPITSWFWKYAVGYYALELAYWISTFAPQITPWINRMWFYLQYSKPTERIDQSFKIFGFECLFRQHVYEWSIPKYVSSLSYANIQLTKHFVAGKRLKSF